MVVTTIARMADVTVIAAQTPTSQRARQVAESTIQTVRPPAKVDQRQSIAGSRDMAHTSIEMAMGRRVSNLGALDPDEILAIRENLEACRRATAGPASRVVPESLCVELEQCLRLLEAEVRATGEKGDG